MNSLCWTGAGTRERSQRDLRRAFYGGIAFVAIWGSNLTILALGWPFLIYGKLKYRKAEPETKLAFQ